MEDDILSGTITNTETGETFNVERFLFLNDAEMTVIVKEEP